MRVLVVYDVYFDWPKLARFVPEPGDYPSSAQLVVAEADVSINTCCMPPFSVIRYEACCYSGEFMTL